MGQTDMLSKIDAERIRPPVPEESQHSPENLVRGRGRVKVDYAGYATHKKLNGVMEYWSIGVMGYVDRGMAESNIPGMLEWWNNGIMQEQEYPKNGNNKNWTGFTGSTGWLFETQTMKTLFDRSYRSYRIIVFRNMKSKHLVDPAYPVEFTPQARLFNWGRFRLINADEKDYLRKEVVGHPDCLITLLRFSAPLVLSRLENGSQH